jgi:ribosomal protein S8
MERLYMERLEMERKTLSHYHVVTLRRESKKQNGKKKKGEKEKKGIIKMKVIENKCISVLNSAVYNGTRGGNIYGPYFDRYLNFLKAFVTEGFLIEATPLKRPQIPRSKAYQRVRLHYSETDPDAKPDVEIIDWTTQKKVKRETRVYGAQFIVRYTENNHPTFSKLVGVQNVTWTITLTELIQRRKGYKARNPIAKKLKEASGFEFLLLKTPQGWMFEREAIRKRTGGQVFYRLFV